MNTHDPAAWPLDELLDEIRAMRSLRDQLADAGCPPHSLESADAEIARLVATTRRCEACGHRDLEPGRPARPAAQAPRRRADPTLYPVHPRRAGAPGGRERARCTGGMGAALARGIHRDDVL